MSLRMSLRSIHHCVTKGPDKRLFGRSFLECHLSRLSTTLSFNTIKIESVAFSLKRSSLHQYERKRVE